MTGEINAALRWLSDNKRIIGDLVNPETDDWTQVARLLYTWRDLLVEDVRQMPAIDLTGNFVFELHGL